MNDQEQSVNEAVRKASTMTKKQKWTAACLTVAAAIITTLQAGSIIASPPNIIGVSILGCGYFMFCIVVIWHETINRMIKCVKKN